MMKYEIVFTNRVGVLIYADDEAQHSFGIVDDKIEIPKNAEGAFAKWKNKTMSIYAWSRTLTRVRNYDYNITNDSLSIFSDVTFRFWSEFQSLEEMGNWLNESETHRLIVGVCPITQVILWESALEKNYVNVTSRNCFRNIKSHKVWRPFGSSVSSLFKCEHCGKYLDVSHRKRIGNKNVCEECLRDMGWVMCHSCGAYVKEDDIKIVDGLEICSGCLESKTEVCSVCGERKLKTQMKYDEGNWLCCDCYDKKHPMCENCGSRSHDIVDMGWGHHVCINCLNTIRGVHEKEQMGYHDYSALSYIANERRTTTEPPSSRYFGVELETEEGYKGNLDIEYWVNHNLVHMEEDGSLGDEGIEFISAPCTLEYHQREFGWKDFCRALKSADCVSHNTSTCGLHIHVTRASVQPSATAKLNVILNRCLPNLSRTLARRSDVYCGNYNTSKKLNVVDGFYSNLPKYLKRHSYINWHVNRYHNDRYVPLNLTNQDTIEFRIFRGTLNHETILASIEYCDAMIEYAASISVRDLNKSEAFHTKTFLEFIKDRDKYAHVMPTILRLNTTHYNDYIKGIIESYRGITVNNNQDV